MKKSLFSYLFLIFLIITFLAGTYVYSTGRDFVFKTKENLTTVSDINNGLNYISGVANEIVNKIDINGINNLENAVIDKYQDVVNKIDINGINNLKSAVIDKYTDIVNNTGSPNSPSNLPTTPYFQHTRPSSNEYVLLSTNPYDFIPNYTTVRYMSANKHSNVYIPDEIVFNVIPTIPINSITSSPITSSPITSSPITSSPSGINIIQFLKNSNRNLIALGDSLTEGYIDMKSNKHPYAIELLNKLNIDSSKILNMGITGNTTSQIYYRLTSSNPTYFVPTFMPTDDITGTKSNILKKYPNPAIMIIFAGTNDLSTVMANPIAYKDNFATQNTLVQNIINEIQLIHNAVLTSSNLNNPTYTVAITLPQNSIRKFDNGDYTGNWIIDPDTWGGNKIYNNLRLKVNEGIRNMVNNSGGKIYLIDLEKYSPTSQYPEFCDQNDQNNQKYWSISQPHFTDQGYDYLGDTIYNALGTFYI